MILFFFNFKYKYSAINQFFKKKVQRLLLKYC